MANLAFLYNTNESGFPEDEDHLRYGRYCVPIFWLASCEVDHIVIGEDEDGEEVPYIEVPVVEACQLFESRKELLSQLLPGSEEYYQEWSQYLESCTDTFLKIDPTEVITMTDEGADELVNSMEFMSRPDEKTLAGLFSITCIADVIDRDTKSLRDLAMIDGEETEIAAINYLIGFSVE